MTGNPIPHRVHVPIRNNSLYKNNQYITSTEEYILCLWVVNGSTKHKNGSLTLDSCAALVT